MSAAVAAGFLINAILSNNGGTENSQSEWRAAVKASERVGVFSPSRFAEAQDSPLIGSDPGIDFQTTSSISRPKQAKPSDSKAGDSVMDLIRKNADVMPSVSSGTDRVSVIVKPGDTLYAISRRHGLSVASLVQMNGLEEPYTIKVGQSIYIAR